MIRNRAAKIFFLIFIIGPLAILVFGGVVMLLWNNVASPVLNLNTITFWQALGILVLAKILFGSFSGSSRSGRNYWKENMMWKHMTPEQRDKFKQEWENRRSWGRRSWKQESQENIQSSESQV